MLYHKPAAKSAGVKKTGFEGSNGSAHRSDRRANAGSSSSFSRFWDNFCSNLEHDMDDARSRARENLGRMRSNLAEKFELIGWTSICSHED